MAIRIGVLVGSLREGSFTRKVARALMDALPESAQARFIEIGDLPLYNLDLDKDGKKPASWERFRKEAWEMDAFIFATPEYNRAITPAIKNALDIASVPFASNAWHAKPAVVVSVSPGSLGGFSSNTQVRQALACLGMHVLPEPEAYLNHIVSSMDSDGNITDERLQGLIKKIAASFAEFAEMFVNKK